MLCIWRRTAKQLDTILEMCVPADPEIKDRGYRLNEIGAYSNWCSWDLILTSARRAPEDIGLMGIQLELVTLHPQCYLVDTRIYPLLELLMLLTDGMSRISACSKRTDVGRFDICQPTTASPP